MSKMRIRSEWWTVSLILFTVLASVEAGVAGQTFRVSVDSSGNQFNDYSRGPSISADGRYVAFQMGIYERMMQIAVSTTGINVFVHDRQTRQTKMVSVDSSGNAGNNYSYDPSISADGQYVAFASSASNLVVGDSGNFDIYVRNLQTAQTTRVSVNSSGQKVIGSSGSPSISGDGRYVAFDSYSAELVSGDTNRTQDVFVHDRQTGQTTRVSVDSSGQQADAKSYAPSISRDGRYVAFASDASNLVVGDTNGKTDVFVHDQQTHRTTRVSVSSSGVQSNERSVDASISANGRYVAFTSWGNRFISSGDTNGQCDVFIHDRANSLTYRGSVNSYRQEAKNGPSYGPSVSDDGRYVAFLSGATNLLVDSGDTNGKVDVFVRDMQTSQTTRVSVNSSGQQANGPSNSLSMSPDGRYVAFDSPASNLQVSGDTNGKDDVFVHDRLLPFTRIPTGAILPKPVPIPYQQLPVIKP